MSRRDRSRLPRVERQRNPWTPSRKTSQPRRGDSRRRSWPIHSPPRPEMAPRLLEQRERMGRGEAVARAAGRAAADGEVAGGGFRMLRGSRVPRVPLTLHPWLTASVPSGHGATGRCPWGPLARPPRRRRPIPVGRPRSRWRSNVTAHYTSFLVRCTPPTGAAELYSAHTGPPRITSPLHPFIRPFPPEKGIPPRAVQLNGTLSQRSRHAAHRG